MGTEPESTASADTVAPVIEAARQAWADWSWQSEPGTDWASFRAGYLAAAVLESVNPTITTEDQLDALPHLALLLRPYQSQAGWNLHEVWEKRHDVWHCLAAPLSPPACHDGVPLLPAILLWSPS